MILMRSGIDIGSKIQTIRHHPRGFDDFYVSTVHTNMGFPARLQELVVNTFLIQFGFSHFVLHNSPSG